MKKESTPTHCEQCGEEPKHKQLRPLENVNGTWLCDRHAEYPKKVPVYMCLETCRGKFYDDNGVITSEEISANNRGKIIEQNTKVVKLKLLNGAVVSVVNKLFEAKWRRET